ncbi:MULTISPECIES: PAAR domain-containing protein [unclassified Paraburkholderia]|uniref:PAAR domain-containing protein n=1 Tax=unclassified Paraburkholderia TaxID=2615204 RepID=UPI000E26EBCF|nr:MULTISPECIES: PAAR domain-containing protein [unclassified Paraburkholderia]REE17373.1 putative Zn-binding protein involved in type VI secretion [Paraburkholderia sp. BL27I4N3]RKR44345.1 putative Zn-binding protein involved in type VI secretion [Paraburkholderia sp. BL17N1]
MRPIALVGHLHSCPMHGFGTVISGASSVTVNGRAVARIGDQTSCGAVIVTGSASTFGGAGVARKGDMTSHGGTLIEGDDSWMLD